MDRRGIQPIPGDELFTKERIRWCSSQAAYYKRKLSLDEDDLLSIAMETVWQTHQRGVRDDDLLRFSFRVMKGVVVDRARYVLAMKRDARRLVKECPDEDGETVLDRLDAGTPDPLHVVMAADELAKLWHDLGWSCGRCHKAVTILRKGLCHSCYKKDIHAMSRSVLRECAHCRMCRRTYRRGLCRRCYESGVR